MSLLNFEYLRKLFFWRRNFRALYLYIGIKKMRLTFEAVEQTIIEQEERVLFDKHYLLGMRLHRIVSEFGCASLMLPSFMYNDITKMTDHDFESLIATAIDMGLKKKIREDHVSASLVSVENEVERVYTHCKKGFVSLQCY